MEISSSNLNFKLTMVKTEELKPHEEVIDSVVASLASEVRREGLLRDPLIVDQEDLVILDGMHRFSSLKLLNCRFIPCCLVDYDSPQISIGSWFRLFRVDDAGSLAEDILKEVKLNYLKASVQLSNESYKPEVIILTRPGDEYSLPEPLDQSQRARIAVSLEKVMVKKGHPVKYLSEIVAFEQLRSGEVNFVIPVPIFTKEQIRDFGLTGHLLPHKVTRHVMPSRPLGINAPLSLLSENSREEAERKLAEILSQRRVERKPPGSVVDGRHYQEELLLFSS